MGKETASGPNTKKKSKKSKRARYEKDESETPDEEVYQVEKILDKRFIDGVAEYFIKWKDWPSNTNTWEPISNLSGAQDLLKEFEAKYGDESEGDVAPPPAGSGAEQNFEVDVLEGVPSGKTPKEILGVIPIDSVLTFLIRWDGGSASTPKSEQYGLVKAEAFKRSHAPLVISYYEKNIIWKRDLFKSKPNVNGSGERSASGSNSSKNKAAAGISSDGEMVAKEEPRGRGYTSSSSDEDY